MISRSAAHVFVFKVALKNAKRIWRRIAIRGDQTLADLHEAIYDAFDRYDEHLYSFYFLKPGVRGRSRLEGAIEFSHPYAAKDAGAFADGPVFDASKRTIASLKLKHGQKFEYLFDFGDSWWHELSVEEIDGEPDKQKYPRLLDKKGESPPQYPDPDEE